VWLQPLADRFLRLVLQLLSRFAAWLSAGLDTRLGTVAAAATPPADAESQHPETQARGAQGTAALLCAACAFRAFSPSSSRALLRAELE
jgi:hypothetical protein